MHFHQALSERHVSLIGNLMDIELSLREDYNYYTLLILLQIDANFKGPEFAWKCIIFNGPPPLSMLL
jgi:hypothetical protein